MNTIVGDEANARTEFIRARGVAKHLREQGIERANGHAYASAVRCANKGGLRTTNGMKYHIAGEDHVIVKNRMYIIWEGQTIEETREALAFAIMMHKVPFVVMSMGRGMQAPGEEQV